MIPVHHNVADVTPEHPVVTKKKTAIANLIRTLQSMQRERIRQGNRLVATLRYLLPEEEQESKLSKKARIGELTPDEKQKLQEKVSSQIMELVREDYSKYISSKGKITGKATFDKYVAHMKYVKTFEEMLLVASYENALAAEELLNKNLGDALDGHPLWEIVKNDKEFYKGIGPKTIGILIAYLDIRKATYVTNLYKYIGLDVVVGEDGVARGRSRRKEHLVMRTTTDQDGNETSHMGLSFNPAVKTMLVGVTIGSIIRAGAPSSRNGNVPSHWYKVYTDYKHRITCREQATAAADPDYVPRTPGHLENMTRRYVIKKVLEALHKAWREYEQLPVYFSYAEGILRLKHHTD